jgi:regulator of sirC expression with transglutaminase-like and TPR domain
MFVGHAVRLNPRASRMVRQLRTKPAELPGAQGDLEGAIADDDQALQLDPNLAEAYEGRGLAYRELGNADAAMADFRRYLGLRPDAEDRAMFEEWIAELEAQLSAP